eukprot:TRINITY_DN1053_c0_g1_i1.p1 TRINITY_DN1053_c0_g1~~TRINITY_DN1053_c0_g1_i1.p1  ORF type:complete len:110 (-),score=8.44 TRINITY_DN1053_c0_g1_i1:369-698(-)
MNRLFSSFSNARTLAAKLPNFQRRTYTSPSYEGRPVNGKKLVIVLVSLCAIAAGIPTIGFVYQAKIDEKIRGQQQQDLMERELLERQARIQQLNAAQPTTIVVTQARKY